MRYPIIAVALLLGSIGASHAQTPTPPGSSALCGATTPTLAVSSTSASVALPVASPTCQTVTLLNDGATEVFFTFGGPNVVATASNVALPAGYSTSVFTTGTYVAAITVSGTSTLRIIQGNGPIPFSHRGGGSSPTPSMAFTALSNGSVSSTIPGSGPYTVTAPSGLTGATWGGGCSGASTVTAFSIVGSLWQATFSTPGTSCSGAITVTGTGGNTAMATSPIVTIGGASGCTNSFDFSASCNSQYVPVVL